MPKPDIVPDKLSVEFTPDQAILLHRAVELLRESMSKNPCFDYHNNRDATRGDDLAKHIIRTGNELLWLGEFDQSLTSYCHAKGYRPFPYVRYL